MNFKIHAIDKGGTRQDVSVEAASLREAFDKIKEQELSPICVLETIHDDGKVTRGLRPEQPGKISPLKHLLAFCAAAAAWVASFLICQALAGGRTGLSGSEVMIFPFICALAAYGAVVGVGAMTRG